MKTKYLIVCMCLVAACTKTGNEPAVNASASANLSKANPNAIITAHKWMYNAFYMHYIDENHKGDPMYIRGANNNEDEILSTDRFTFKTNHNFTQTEGDYVYRGTWRFSNNVPTLLIMNYDWGTDNDSIVMFDIKHLKFIQSFGYHEDDHSLTELMPAN